MRRNVLRAVPAIVLVLFVSAARAEQPTTRPARVKTEFLKFVEDDHGGGKLETAVADYKNDDGVTVHLVAAVHVGEESYYENLNKTFEKYDALLYEMVKPKDAAPPAPGEERPSTNMISMFQRFLKDALELQFQLDAIDYTKPNFVHADLDVETFQRMQEERGESMMTLMLQEMLRQLAKAQNGEAKEPEFGLMDLLNVLTSPDRARQLKMLLGRQFGDIEEQMAGMAGGTVIITERNKACFKVLKKEIADGKKNIGIFYGAGHMGDMEKRLQKMGFQRTGVDYRVAWDMTKGKAADDDDDAKPAPKHAKPKHDSDDDDDDASAKKVGFFPSAR